MLDAVCVAPSKKEYTPLPINPKCMSASIQGVIIARQGSGLQRACYSLGHLI